jgi:hypothetical protein
MSRIYIIKDSDGKVERYVRADTKNGAVRAYAAEVFTVEAASSDDIFLASKAGSFDVLDAVDAS